MYEGYQYRPLCDVTFLHGYFLNIGADAFDSLSASDKKIALKRYTYSDVFDLIPIAGTAEKLKNHRILQTSHQHGIRLSIRTKNDLGDPLILPKDDEFFVYAIRMKDKSFLKYTESGISEKTLYLFTNSEPDRLKNSDGVDVDLSTSPDLMPKINEADFISDDFILSEVDSDLIKENYMNLSNKTGVIGFLYIRAKSTDTTLSTLNETNKVRLDFPHFKIHFKALETFWKYRKDAIDFEAETSAKKALSKHGFTEIDPLTDFTVAYLSSDPEAKYKYPNPIPGTIEIQEGSGSDPDKIYSVIYI